MATAFDIKPIPTLYAGVSFRSRIEARWACFLDHLQVSWLYEQEPCSLPSGRYLPDFLLPELDTWVEIKGCAPFERERSLCRELTEATARRTVLCYGAVGSWLGLRSAAIADSPLVWLPRLGPDGEVVAMADEGYWPCTCPVCGRFDFQYKGNGARVCRSGACCPNIEKLFTFDSSRILSAVDASNKRSFYR